MALIFPDFLTHPTKASFNNKQIDNQSFSCLDKSCSCTTTHLSIGTNEPLTEWLQFVQLVACPDERHPSSTLSNRDVLAIISSPAHFLIGHVVAISGVFFLGESSCWHRRKWKFRPRCWYVSIFRFPLKLRRQHDWQEVRTAHQSGQRGHREALIGYS